MRKSTRLAHTVALLAIMTPQLCQYSKTSKVAFNGGYLAGISRKSSSVMGTLFALVIGSNSVAQCDDEFSVKFRANRLRSWLALADQLESLTSARFLGSKLHLPDNCPGWDAAGWPATTTRSGKQ